MVSFETLARLTMAALALACVAAIPSRGSAMAAPDPDRMRDLTAEWEYDHHNVIWNYVNLYNPRVVHEPGSDYPFKMWLFGWAAADDNPGYPGADAVFLARAKDLDHWEVYAGEQGWDRTMNPRLWVPVMTADSKPYDNVHNGDPAVVRRGGAYYMALSSVGFDTRTGPGGSRIYVISCVMGARSKDGIHWEKSPAPILIWKDEYMNGWALLDGKIGGPPAEYYGSYHRPALLYDRGHWRLWFDYFHPGTFVSMGCAENAGDFLRPQDWRVVRADREPLLRDWPNPSVVKAGDRYYVFSDAPNYPADMGGDGRQITMAESRDGMSWHVLGHIRPEGMDSSHVPEALVLKDRTGTWLYLFYSWKPATKAGAAWDYRYKAIRYMRRRLPEPSDTRARR
jgi:hypothetical protein